MKNKARLEIVRFENGSVEINRTWYTVKVTNYYANSKRERSGIFNTRVEEKTHSLIFNSLEEAETYFDECSNELPDLSQPIGKRLAKINADRAKEVS